MATATCHLPPDNCQLPTDNCQLTTANGSRYTSFCVLMNRFLNHFRLALWRAFQHDAFAVAKAAAFSAILTLFPAILVVASVLSMSHTTKAMLREVSHALGRILPEGTSDAVTQYFTGSKPVPLKLLLIISALT